MNVAWVWIERRATFAAARRRLLVVVGGGVSLDAVSHEESVGAGGDEGMARSHNLKAQETECTEQGCCGETRTEPASTSKPRIRRLLNAL